MSRHPVVGTCRDTSNGQVRGLSTVSVYLAGGTVPALIYTASSGGTVVNSVTSDSYGKFLFYIDEGDYSLSQLFKIVSSKTGYDSITYDNLPFFSFQCIDTDVSLSSNSDKKIPTQKAIKTYIDTVVSAIVLAAGSLPAATTENDFISADGSLNWVKRSLGDTQTILGLDNYILKTVLTANTIMGATVDSTPDNLTISEILDFIGSTAEGDTIYRGTSTWDRLAKGTANYKKFMNAAGTAPEWASGIKIGTFTRGMSVASGDVSITGVGFKPSVVIFLSCLATTSMTIGFDDASTHLCIMNYNSGTDYYYTSNSIMLWYSSSNYQAGLLKSLDSDGFTLTWSKTGSPGGTAIIHYLAIR